ncbi:MAG: hypothetical protein JNL54_00115, partial [Kineosporiaceae bacterium]|nr:hypothetical protein [Kineosporiaceae bacterium]
RGSPIVAALVMAAGFLFAFSDPAAAGQAQASIAIVDDDAGRALFHGALMAPGHDYTQCLRIQAGSLTGTDAVYLRAVEVDGSLAEHLDLRIEIGDGARYGDCASFVGEVVFDGSLRELAGADPQGIATGWHPAVHAARSFRITASLGPGAITQGEQAEGSFLWRLDSAGTAGGDPTPTPSRTPTVSPTGGPAPSGATSASVTQTATPDSPTASAPTSATTTDTTTATATATQGPGPGDGGSSSAGSETGLDADLTIGGTIAQLGEVARKLATTVTAVAVRPQYPLLALLLAVAFLIVQDRIDRRDPKLAVALTRQRDSELIFPDRFGGAL